MSEKVFFSEKQKFNQWWLWLLLIGLNGMFIFKIVKQIYYKNIYATEVAIDAEFTIGFSIVFLVTTLFYFFQLETIIKNDGIYVRFFPIHFAYKKYSWDTLEKCYIRKYNPLSEYGGWGIRMGLFGKGNALNVSGNMGLQLEILNETNLLIGTNNPDELKDVLIQLSRYKS